jgi:Fe-S-cluster containining protein
MTKRHALPVITPADCKGCGACCRHVGHPMFGPLIDEATGRQLPAPLLDPEFVALPRHLRRELVEYRRFLLARDIGDDFGWPCIWLKPDGTCRHYEHRPRVCRDFELGGEACLRFRREQGIGLARTPLFKQREGGGPQ